MLIKYSQNYDFYIFYFVSLEVGTAAFKIFRVMIPSLVDTSLDFGLFRVVRTYGFYFSHTRNGVKPQISEIVNLNFQSLEVVSLYRTATHNFKSLKTCEI